MSKGPEIDAAAARKVADNCSEFKLPKAPEVRSGFQMRCAPPPLVVGAAAASRRCYRRRRLAAPPSLPCPLCPALAAAG